MSRFEEEYDTKHEEENDDHEDQEENDSEEQQYFTCKLDNNKLLIELLVSLSVDAVKDNECYIEATPGVLLFSVVGRGKNTQCRVSFPSDSFEDYTVSHESVTFAVKLSTLIDCLKLFGTSDSTTTILSYDSTESILKISLEESGVLTICEITCLYIEDFAEIQQSLFLAFRNSPEECQIIIKSEALKNAIHEIGDSNVDSVVFEVNNSPASLKIIASGPGGYGEIFIPRTSDAYVTFSCQRGIAATYQIKALLLGMKALNVGKETYLRINSEGVMCLQHQIESKKGENIFFDFIMLSEEPPDN